MRSTSLVVAVVLTAVSTLAADATSNRHIDTPTVPMPLDINMYQRAPVTGLHLAGALTTATNLYKSANVRLIWHSAPDPDAPVGQLTIVVAASDSRFGPIGSLDTLGSVVQPGVRAYLLYDRVVRFARYHKVDPARVLGQAIAHEIGHLLLGMKHSSTGVMAAQIDPLRITEIAFAPDETRAIQASVTAIQSTVVSDLHFGRDRWRQ